MVKPSLSSSTSPTSSLSSHLMSLITTTAPSSTSSTSSTGLPSRSPTQAEKNKASFKNQVAPLPNSRPKLIAAPDVPHRRSIHRGVSFPSDSGLAQPIASPSLSKEDKAERRKAKLKEVAEISKKANVPTRVTREEDESVPTLRAPSNKANKTQALLAAMKDDSTPTQDRKKAPPMKLPPSRHVPNYGAPTLPSPSPKPASSSSSRKPGFLSEIVE